MNFRHITKPIKVLLATATVTLGGCPAFGNQIIPVYLCELAKENARINIQNIIDSTESTTKMSLIIFYDAYKNNIINIQQECPEDNQEAWGIQETEPLVNSLWEYKLKSLKD